MCLIILNDIDSRRANICSCCLFTEKKRTLKTVISNIVVGIDSWIYIGSIDMEASKGEDGQNGEGEETDEKEDSSKVPPKERVKEMLDKMPKISKPSFLKKSKDGHDEAEGGEGIEGEDLSDGDKKNFFDNVKTKASQVPALLKKKKEKGTFEDVEEDTDKDESKELLNESAEKKEDGDNHKKLSMKPAAMAVLESIRSAAHHVPAMFKKNKESVGQKDIESGVTGDLEEQKELLEKRPELKECNKAVPEDDLEEIKINTDDEKALDTISGHSEKKRIQRKPPRSPKSKGVEKICRMKEVSRQCSQRFQELETRRKIAVIAILLGVLLLILIIGIAAGSSPSGWSNEIRFIEDGKYVEAHTSCGTVIGLVDAPDQLRFTGIPYAANISNRFEQSHIASNLEESVGEKNENGDIVGDEDCLTLNIYTTSVTYEDFMPVVVYIRGDDESESLAPSSELSKNMSVVFVEVNYRLGNYGLGDIITALKWVSLNIQHFGGHPKKVTLLGSGFGATLVTALTSSRLGKGFYSGIWVSNGAGSFANRTLEQVSVENEKINIPDEWLTSSTSQLPQIGEKEYSWIVVDKHILTHHPVSYWINHASEIDVPMVFGSTEHVEATEKNINLMDWDDRDVFEAHVEEKLGSFNVTLPGLALSFYNTSDNWIDYISMLSDIRTVCPIMNLAEMASANSNKNVYSYIATQTRVGDLGNIADAHSDISAIFGLYEPKNSTEIRFVTNIQKLFYKFVKSGSLPYGNRDVALGYYDVNARVSFKHEPRSTCQFWENANYIVPEYANLD
ncbi:unnamed protein product [Lepeophtheirus salmonis]|uniref:(salmon louse) hypothetical protein n=1 Tax=Lepeophtheirus salmonis TaxID=72036 RepID=A0A7R8HCE0_LEPSM|nr:unnamed protein product [Lepeophtheirus salmonis]CAF3013271.1 unnamed protein product [Lepeophtheirus salmonis]